MKIEQRYFYRRACQKEPVLPGLQVHTIAPASFGLVSYMGFEEMIPAGAPLLCCKRSTLRTIFDHIDSDIFTVAYQHTPRHPFQEIQRVTLKNIRKGQAKDVKLFATMTIDRTLTGFLHLRDPYTKSEVSITFDARVPPPKPLLLGNRAHDDLD